MNIGKIKLNNFYRLNSVSHLDINIALDFRSIFSKVDGIFGISMSRGVLLVLSEFRGAYQNFSNGEGGGRDLPESVLGPRSAVPRSAAESFRRHPAHQTRS